MATEFELKINQVRKIHSIPATEENNYKNDLSDVIITVYYTYSGKSGDHVFRSPGVINLEYPSATDDFILIDDITEEIVLDWINANQDFESLKVFIDNELDKMISPPESNVYFDWLPDPFAKKESVTPENTTPIESEESSESED